MYAYYACTQNSTFQNFASALVELAQAGHKLNPDQELKRHISI